MNAINFYYENVDSFFDKKIKYLVRNWIIKIAQLENRKIEELVYIFCTDEYLYDINIKYLEHDTLTDVITFDYCHDDYLNGEMYISIDRVNENAKIYNVTFTNELLRVVIHGVLHLMGYKDKTDEDAQIMRSKEAEALKYLNNENISLHA